MYTMYRNMEALARTEESISVSIEKKIQPKTKENNLHFHDFSVSLFLQKNKSSFKFFFHFLIEENFFFVETDDKSENFLVSLFPSDSGSCFLPSLLEKYRLPSSSNFFSKRLCFRWVQWLGGYLIYLYFHLYLYFYFYFYFYLI